MGDYQRLQTEAENEVHVSRPLSREDLYYAKHMSPVHKVAFGLSIICCAAVVIVFLWVLPCNLDSCVDNFNSVNIFSWNKTLTGVELKGQLHFVSGNLIGIFRGALWGSIVDPLLTPYSGGVIALVGKTGCVAWYKKVPMPTYLDCSLLDMDSSGGKGCLVLGENGYLEAINSLSGLTSWILKSPNASIWPTPRDIDLPVSIPDMNKDGIGDLATLSRFTSGKHRVAIISAKSGQIINEPFLDQKCSHVSNLTYDSTTATLHYKCTTENEGYRIIEYPLTGAPKPRNKTVTWKNLMSERKWKPVKENSSIGEHRVIVSNGGTCPANCTVSVIVTDPENQTIWKYNTTEAYAMFPLPLHFKHSITGFLLKLWHWHPNTTKSGDLKTELIKERIVLITFNKTGEQKHHYRVVNASQTDIIQLCNATECQPQLSFQTQSALIADLNNDGSQDLVSYFVTYVGTKDDATHTTELNEWKLQSSVRVVRLEAELPKLYDAVSKH